MITKFVFCLGVAQGQSEVSHSVLVFGFKTGGIEQSPKRNILSRCHPSKSEVRAHPLALLSSCCCLLVGEGERVGVTPTERARRLISLAQAGAIAAVARAGSAPAIVQVAAGDLSLGPARVATGELSPDHGTSSHRHRRA